LGLKEDGSIVAVGETGQIENPIEEIFPSMNASRKITSIYSGYYNVGAILDDGTVVWSSNNGRDDTGMYNNTVNWSDLVQVAIGSEHTVGLCSDGTVYAAGNNSDGQCEVSDWKDIVYIAAGQYSTFGIKSDGTLLIAGETNIDEW
jgi:hypothetical protein